MLISRQSYEYLLGVFLGDGSTYSKNGICITVGKDVYSYARYISNLLSPYQAYIHKDFYSGKKQKAYCYRVRASDKNFFPEYFSQYKNNGLWTLPRLQNPAYLLAGIFDSDGSIRQRHRKQNPSPKFSPTEIIIYQKNKENLELILPLFDELNIFPTLRNHTLEPPHWVLALSNWTQVEIFKRYIPSQHPRKSMILQKAGDPRP